jgi:hypothetical protein
MCLPSKSKALFQLATWPLKAHFSPLGRRQFLKYRPAAALWWLTCFHVKVALDAVCCYSTIYETQRHLYGCLEGAFKPLSSPDRGTLTRQSIAMWGLTVRIASIELLRTHTTIPLYSTAAAMAARAVKGLNSRRQVLPS